MSDARDPLTLRRLQGREQARRWLVWGLIVATFGGGWLFFAWRASRYGEAECFVRVPAAGYCAIGHELDGELHERAWQSCDEERGWRDPSGALSVDDRARCFYYRSLPSEIALTRPAHRGWSPVALGLFVAGLVVAGAGLARRRAWRDSSEGRPATTGYRAPAARIVEARPRLEVPLVQRHWSRWVGGAPFLLLGATLFALTLHLAWQSTGELDGGTVALTAFSCLVLGAGIFGVFYRSGLVLDAERGLFFHWWGLGRPWFRNVRALESLLRVEAETRGSGRATAHYLTLHFADSRPLRYAMRPERASLVVEELRVYRAVS